jgi:hypothetical protein
MLLAYGQEVEPGTREDVAVFWTDGDDRRVIVDCGYGTAHTAIERILRRFSGGRGYYESLRLKVGELAEPGSVITAIVAPHQLGLMRPYIAGELGPEPYLVCRERSFMPHSPVLCASVEDARSFVRLASAADGLPLSGWRGFRAERLLSEFESLFALRANGSVGFRSELEEALSVSRAKARDAIIKPSSRQSRSKRKRAA